MEAEGNDNDISKQINKLRVVWERLRRSRTVEFLVYLAGPTDDPCCLPLFDEWSQHVLSDYSHLDVVGVYRHDKSRLTFPELLEDYLWARDYARTYDRPVNLVDAVNR